MSSFLIVGGNFETRKNSAIKLIKKKLQDEYWSPVSNPDFLVVEEATSIGIERIRSLQDNLSLKPFGQEKKIAFLPQAETITIEAQNALLKTLEEPSEKTLLILCAPSPEWLLPTVASRCQIIQLPVMSQVNLTEEEFKKFLEIFNEISQEGIGERFKILEDLQISSDRQNALEWLDKITFLVRKLLLDFYLKESKSAPNLAFRYLIILKSLAQTKVYLEANTNIRLTLENFLLFL